MEKKIKVSVVLPLYKNERYLEQCINSVVNQTLKDIEIILCDKMASTRVKEIIDNFAKKDQRVKILSFKDNGYGASVNRGINFATGEYISIVESDDFIDENMLEEMYNYGKNLNSDVVKSSFWEYKENGNRSEYPMTDFLDSILPHDKNFAINEYPQLLSTHASIWAALYKRQFLLNKNIKVVEANGAGYVDVGFRIDTLTKADSISWLRKAYYNYRTSNVDSSTSNWNAFVMLSRWNEVHKRVSIEEYNKWGNQTFADEYLNTFFRNESFASRKCRKLMKENLSFIPDCIIDNAPFVSINDKDYVKRLKKNFALEVFKKQNTRLIHAIRKIINFDYSKNSMYPAIISMLTWITTKSESIPINKLFLYFSYFFIMIYFFGYFVKILKKTFSIIRKFWR